MSHADSIRVSKPKTAGFTLVEILLTLALLGLVTLSVTNMLVKASSLSSSMDSRYQQTTEVQAVLLDIMKDLQQGAYISNNSHNARLEYTTYDASGNAVKKIYGVCYAPIDAPSSYTTCRPSVGSNNTPYFKLSTDGGSTWGSPYRVSAYNRYRLSGTPIFLYAHDANNCTSFVDTDANGVWLGSALGGTDAAGVFSDCGSNDTSSPVLTTPNQATKVVLSGFQFTTGTGTPVVTRNLPSNIFMLAPQGVVVSTTAAVSPGVKDSALVKSFDTATTNSLFGSGFVAYGLAWDPSRERLLVAGRTSNFTGMIFQVDRTGVLIGPPKSLIGSHMSPEAVQLLNDGQSVAVLDYTTYVVNWYNLSDSSPLKPYKTFNLWNPSASSPSIGSSSPLIQQPYSLLLDPKYPDEIFVVGQDPADSGWKIFEFSTVTGALATTVISGGKLALPAAFTTSTPPFGITQEPTTGDFLVALDSITGTAPNRTISIYRITSGGSSSSFTINVDDLGSTATGITAWWNLAYNPASNHFFLSDVKTGKIYEAYPDRLISPRK